MGSVLKSLSVLFDVKKVYFTFTRMRLFQWGLYICPIIRSYVGYVDILGAPPHLQFKSDLKDVMQIYYLWSF